MHGTNTVTNAMTHLYSQAMSVSPAQRALRKLQRPHCFWFTGLSGAGKSTLANALDLHLNQHGIHSYLVDGDVLRHGLCADLGFKDEDRAENVRRAAQLAKVLFDAGVIPIVALISPTKTARSNAKALWGTNEFSEIYVRCDVQTCSQRDPKGLYSRYAKGAIHGVSGLDSPYEIPEHADLTVNTQQEPIEQCIDQVLRYALHKLG
jgi:adenylyl-sulfate kinase